MFFWLKLEIQDVYFKNSDEFVIFQKTIESTIFSVVYLILVFLFRGTIEIKCV